MALAQAFAQRGPTQYQKRAFYSRVYTLLSQYEDASGFFDNDYGDDTRNMLRIFDRNKDAMVYMDILGSPDFGSQVSLGEYLDYVKNSGLMLKFIIEDVERGDCIYTGKEFRLDVSFTKSVAYYDANDVYLSSEVYYGKPSRLKAVFVYDISDDKCYIESIEGDNSLSPLPSNLTVIRRNRDNLKARNMDSLLVFNNRMRPFDIFDQAYTTSSPALIQSWDPDILVSYETLPVQQGTRYQLVQFRYKPLLARLRAHFSFAPISAYSVVSEDEFVDKSSAWEIGLEAGYTFPVGPMKLGVYSGFGLSFSNLSLGKGSMDYSFNVSDASGNLVNRPYQLDTATMSLSFSDVYLPIFADLEYRTGDRLALHAKLGPKFYLNMGTKITSPYRLTGLVDGQNVDIEPQAFLLPVSYERNLFDVSLYTGLDVDITIVKNRWFGFMGVAYEYGLTNSYFCNESRYFDPENEVFPLVYYASMSQDVAYTPMTSGVSYRRKMLWFNFGFSHKF